MSGISHLIINSAYCEPKFHWKFNAGTQSFEKAEGRRSAGYVIASEERNGANEQGRFIELPTVNEIRRRVKKWREGGYKGVTAVTRKLLKHWHDESAREYPFYFCQLDAIETIIWWTEALDTERQGIELDSDGSDFQRICTKMCTGSGKTTVMGLLITWMICNKAAYPRDKRFTKYVLIVTPGLTVRNRLMGLTLGGTKNEYANFKMVPSGMSDMLHQGKVKVVNWQTMQWDTLEDLEKKKSVDKRGPKSDEAYTRDVLGELSQHKNILVINDEAHHAWRKNPEVKIALKGQDKKDYQLNEEQATVWIGGLDRINKVRHILRCYDFSATPFAPSGKKNDEEALFTWIISDFGLNDGIESGLVKTPRVVVRDDGIPGIDGTQLISKLYHIYRNEEVHSDINRADAKPEEPLPDLVRQAYVLLGKDWEETFNAWKQAGNAVPPVMISVANRTETAARIKYMFESKDIPVPALCEPEHLIQIDSKLLKSIETEEGTSKKDKESELREIVDTVGKIGKPGEQIRNVISVGMLSEGWDARNVTHIFGLRAFSSQLLCEQVIGRGLRRTTYDVQEDNHELFAPEYVNIVGIPFSFLPHEEGGTPGTQKPKTQIEAMPSKKQYEISWPNIIRFDRVYKQTLTVDFTEIPEKVLDATDVRLSADLAPILNGQTDITKLTTIDLEKLYKDVRIQSIIFEAAGKTYKALASNKEWAKNGTQYSVLGQIVNLTEAFLRSKKIIIKPELFSQNETGRRVMLIMKMSEIVGHLCEHIKDDWTEKMVPIYDTVKPVLSTGDMMTWFTTKPCMPTKKSHISHVVRDSGLEESEAWVLERNDKVIAYAKNNHLGYEIPYLYNGAHHSYTPDFLIKLKNGKILVLETKGLMTEKDEKKRKALAHWIKGVNDVGTFGKWCCDVSRNVKDVNEIIDRHCEE